MGPEFGRGTAHHLHDPRLGGGVHALARLDHHGPDRTEEDDGPRALHAHDPSRGLDDVRAALEVEAQNAVDLLVGVVEEGFAHVHSGGADHDVEGSASGRDVLECASDCRAVQDVHMGRGGLSPGRADCRCGTGGGVRVDVEAGHVRTRLRASDRNGFADAGAAADDRGRASLQAEHRGHKEPLAGFRVEKGRGTM